MSAQASLPAPSSAGLGPAYEFPNHTQSMHIVGAFPYPRGPAVWNDTMASPEPFGGWGLSTGWTYNLAHPDAKTGKCPPIPDDAWGNQLDRSKLWVSTDPAVPGGCFIGCNRSAIEAGAPDPCNAGSIWIDTPRFGRVLANYSCFFGGAGWMKDPSAGQCGFNCTAFDIFNKTPCNIWEANAPKAQCNVECSPAKF